MAIKEVFNLERVVADMQQHWPSKRTDHRSIALKYFKLVKQALIKGIQMANTEQVKLGLIPVNFHSLKKQCGRYGDKGQQKYWFYWFQEHHPLMTKVKQGSKIGKQGELTMVKITREVEMMLSAKDAAEVFKTYYEQHQDQEMDWVSIDSDSLDAYIRHNKDTQQYASRNDSHRETLRENLKQAELIQLIASFTGGEIPQVVHKSPFGRRYYRGVNLQSAPKIVRHAALGDCYQYDIEASVFTWKFCLAKELNANIKLPATLDYLDYKQHHRERLAQMLFGNKTEQTIKTVKRVITAVGFGARTTNTVWRLENGSWQTSALKDIIYDSNRLQRLFNDPWFKEFVQEQDVMTRMIFDSVKENPGLKNRSILLTPGGKLSKNKTISFLYQNTEAEIIKALEQRLISRGHKILLICHDGFYTKHKIDVVDLRYELQQYLPNGKLEEVKLNAFKYHPDSVIDENQHKNFIANEEQRVAVTLGKSVHVPQKLTFSKAQRNDEYDNGYDDGSRAYAAPEWDFYSELKGSV